MRGWVAGTKPHRRRLNDGQNAAVETILAPKDRGPRVP